MKNITDALIKLLTESISGKNQDEKEYKSELEKSLDNVSIEEKILVNTTGNFGKKGDKTYLYKLTDTNGNRLCTFEFDTPQTNQEIKDHYVEIYTNPKYDYDYEILNTINENNDKINKKMKLIKTYNETDYGWHNNATTLYGELADGNYYSYVPDNESLSIYNAPITDKYIDTAYNYQTDDERADDEWFDNFNKEHDVTNKYNQDQLFALTDELDNIYFNGVYNSYTELEDKKEESSKLTETADEETPEEVKQEIDSANDTTEPLANEVAASTIDVLIADEKSAIDGYDSYINQVSQNVEPELVDAIANQMDEIKQDEEEHIEKLQAIKQGLIENKTVTVETVDNPVETDEPLTNETDEVIDTEQEVKESIKSELIKFCKQNGLDIEKLKANGIVLEDISNAIDNITKDMVSQSMEEYLNNTGLDLVWDFEIADNDINIILVEPETDNNDDTESMNTETEPVEESKSLNESTKYGDINPDKVVPDAYCNIEKTDTGYKLNCGIGDHTDLGSGKLTMYPEDTIINLYNQVKQLAKQNKVKLHDNLSDTIGTYNDALPKRNKIIEDIINELQPYVEKSKEHQLTRADIDSILEITGKIWPNSTNTLPEFDWSGIYTQAVYLVGKLKSYITDLETEKDITSMVLDENKEFNNQIQKVTESARDDKFNETIQSYIDRWGYEMFKQQDGITALVNKTRDSRGPIGIIFSGKSSKPISNYVYPGEDGLERFSKSVDKAITNAKAWADVVAQRREQNKLTSDHNIKVGDIFYTSWGYDQTNSEFYKVVEVKGSRIYLRELKSEIQGNDGAGSDIIVPSDEFEDDKIHTVSARVNGTVTNLDGTSFLSLSKWNGKPVYVTDAYSGH